MILQDCWKRGYDDEKNIEIGKSDEVDVLYSNRSARYEKGEHSGWKYDYYENRVFRISPVVNVEILWLDAENLPRCL